jgi:predicted Zn-dependent protease with MMP-like domain
MRLSPERFEELVVAAIDTLPEPFAQRLQNVEVVIEDHPSRRQLRDADTPRGSTLLGLYEGVPLTARGSGYGMVLPDKITIFQRPIEEMCASEADVREQVRHTVVHEIAHFFGISDDQLRKMGAY